MFLGPRIPGGLMLIPTELALALGNRRKKLGEILIDQNLIDDEQLETALIYQKVEPGVRLGTVLERLGYVRRLDLMEALVRTMPTVRSYSERGREADTEEAA
jgi:hypothetical protein